MTVFDPYGATPVGSLRRRLSLEIAADTDDGGGGVTRAWQAVGSVWALIEPVRGDAIVIAGAPEAVVSHRVTLRWRGDIGGANRFADCATIYRIRAAFDPDGTRRRLVCLTQEIKA